MPPFLNTPWRTIPAPLSLSSMMVLTFYWHESLNGSSLKLSLSVDRFKVPLYLLVALLFIVELSIDIVFWLDLYIENTWIGYIQSIYYGIVGIGLSVFYITTAARILIQVRKISSTSAPTEGQSKKLRGRTKARSVARKLFAIGSIILLMESSALSTLAPDYVNGVPSWFFSIWYLIQSFILMKAVATVLLLRPKRGAQPGSKTSTSRHSLTET
jgi:hypothetical protein